MYRPEVGEECVWYSDRGNKIGKECVIEWTDGEYYTVRNKDSFKLVQTVSDVKFRPLKSKRDEEIDEMVDVVLNHNGESSVGSFCETIHDAGYRKQMPYSQFVSKIQVYLKENNCFYLDVECLSHARSFAEKLGRTPEEN
jgi:hypothetical protein